MKAVFALLVLCCVAHAAHSLHAEWDIPETTEWDYDLTGFLQTGHEYKLHYECGGRDCERDENPDIVLDENWKVIFSNGESSIVPYPPMYRVLVNPKGAYDRKCVWFHGLGGGIAWPVVENIPMYDMMDCRRIYIAKLPTHELAGGWENDWLQDLFVKLIKVAGYDYASPHNTKIFANNFANLVLAGAIMNNKFQNEDGSCLFDGRMDKAYVDGKEVARCEAPRWFMIEAPLRGSKIVQILWNLCHRTIGSLKTSYGEVMQEMELRKKDLRNVLKWVGRCTSPFKTKHGVYTSYAYYSMHPEHKHLANDDVFRTAYRYAAGAMCGVCPKGINSTSAGRALQFLNQLADYGEDADGLTPLSSCQNTNIPNNWVDDWQDNVDGAWYKARINAAEGSGLYVDADGCDDFEYKKRGDMNKRVRDQCPSQWVKAMSKREADMPSVHVSKPVRP